jgi:hypothetical protein
MSWLRLIALCFSGRARNAGIRAEPGHQTGKIFITPSPPTIYKEELGERVKKRLYFQSPSPQEETGLNRYTENLQTVCYDTFEISLILVCIKDTAHATRKNFTG